MREVSPAAPGETDEVSIPVMNIAPSFCTARVAPSTAVSGVPG